MAAKSPWISALKQLLKQHGKTYRDVARVLGLQESSVKRLMASGKLSISRFDEVCAMLGVDVGDLLRVVSENRERLHRLSEAQERELVSDHRLLLVAVCVLNRMSLQDILSRYEFEAHECVKHLMQLDRLQILDLLPNNRIKLSVAPNFSWLPNGPIQQYFFQNLQAEYFASRFDQDEETFVCQTGMLSDLSKEKMKQRLGELSDFFARVSDQDAHRPVSEREGTTLVLAMRSWEPAILEALRRPAP